MREMTGRVAVITGAGGGIGRQVALELARRGCHVAATDVRSETVEETVDLVTRADGSASVHVADVTDLDRMHGLADEVASAHGGVHILVNNAGVTSAGAFEKESAEDMHWIVDINMWGVVHGCQAFLPVLRQQDEAHIVNMSSMVALMGLPHNAIYSLTKGAVRSFSEALRAELVGSHIGLTTVFPGAHRTGITDTARGSQAARLADLGRSRYAPLAMRSPASLARRIANAVEHNRARVVAGPDARALDVWARLAPGRIGTLGRLTGAVERRP